MVNKQVLFYIFLLLSVIYQDFPLVNLIGEIGRSPVFLLCPFFLWYILSNKNILVSKYIVYYSKYILYLILISVLFLAISYYNNNFEIIVLGDNLIIKTVKMLVYPLVSFILYVFIYRYLSNNFDKLTNLFNAVFLVQLFLCIFISFEVYFLKTNTKFLPFLYSIPEKYWRIRLLTMEESWVGSVLIIFTFLPVFLALYCKVSKVLKNSVYAMSIYLFLIYSSVSESKGFLLLTILSVIPLTFSYIRNNRYIRKISVFLTPIFLIIGVSLGVVLYQIVEEQLTTNGTFGTRFSTVVSAVNLFIHSPIGVGYSGFVYYFPQSLEYVLESGMFDNFSLQEVNTYLSTTKALSTKSDFFDNLMFGGIGFLIFIYYFIIKKYQQLLALKSTVFYFLRIPFLFVVLASITYITLHIKYDVWFLFAIIDVFIVKDLKLQDEKN